MSYENRNYAFAGALVSELARCGLRHVCICPGSRSSPLAISFARHPGIKKWVHLDERSASFFALGMAKRLGEPVAMVCSSGTATANFFPAIVEAHYSSTPLLVLTADRPPEVQEWGALQTVDQTRMYGSHVKWAVNLPPPEVTPGLMAYVRSLAGRAFDTANGTPAGPVHLNVPFREPLEPVNVPADFSRAPAKDSPVYGGRSHEQPFLRSLSAAGMPSSTEIQRFAQDLCAAERGVIVCGPGVGRSAAEGIVRMARSLGYPVLADCLSQVRCGPHERDVVIDCYDAFVGISDVAASLAPDVVIRFGCIPVSKPLTAYLERYRDARHILVDGDALWRDPFHLTAESWHTGPELLCESVCANLQGEPRGEWWLGRWTSIAESARRAIEKEIPHLEGMFEGRIFRELAALLPDDSLLFAGNSMPVRDMDAFFPSTATSVLFMANRGASGIDGVVSTALGAGAAHSGKMTLVIGDISFYHDMNGLLAVKAFGLKPTIIVINNNGGGIFSFLPQADYEETFERYFGTPHGLSFEHAAGLYGLDYHRVKRWPEFEMFVRKSLSGETGTIIEVAGDRRKNFSMHQRVRNAVAAAVRETGRA